MIDHVLGKPSPRFRKYQVFTVVLLWSLYLWKGDRHGPPRVRDLSAYLSKRLTTWQTLVLALLYLYVGKNFARVVGLESPEPLANLYTRSFFRATWVTTALDAGFWTAMNLKPNWLKHIASMVFSFYYLICAEQADEKVRKVRGALTLQHLRVSWDKSSSPILRTLGSLLRPRFMKYQPRRLRIPRPKASSYKEFIDAWLYFDGPVSALKQHDKIILDIPGGGFIAMNPRCHDDRLLATAGRTGLPVLALNYKKAPEFPYPYALNECYDAYYTLITTRGRCVGLSGAFMPKIVVSGDSAGGNLAVGMTLMLLQSSPHASYFPGDASLVQLPLPEALILVYPSLDMNINNWITDEQMALIKAPERRGANSGVIRRTSDDYRKLTPDTPYASDDEADRTRPRIPSGPGSDEPTLAQLRKGSSLTANPTLSDQQNLSTVRVKPSKNHQKDLWVGTTQNVRTRLAMSSMISYFNDRVLTPEMQRAMIILYIGPYNRPDFATDFLLSPLLAPEPLLAKMPKTYMLTGERDPLVDNTVIFAGRLRQAKLFRFRERQELGLTPQNEPFRESDYVETLLVPGISHGFLNFVAVYPEGWKYITQYCRWIKAAFHEADRRDSEGLDRADNPSFGGHEQSGQANLSNRHARTMRRESSGDEDRPLEMGTLCFTTRIPKTDEKLPGRRHGGKLRAGSERANVSSRGSVRKPASSGRKSPLVRRKSLVSLASTEDLMRRRMTGLTGGLLGDSSG